MCYRNIIELIGLLCRMVDTWLDRSNDALSKVLHDTYFSKKLLQKPPFTFLHKALVEILKPIDLFSDNQLTYQLLESKEDKVCFQSLNVLESPSYHE